MLKVFRAFFTGKKLNVQSMTSDETAKTSRSISYATRYLSRLLVFVSVNTAPKSCGRSFLFTQTIRHLGSEDQSKHRAGLYCFGVRI